MFEFLFFVSLFFLIYIFIIYPLLLFVISRFKQNPFKSNERYFPGVSIIIAAYNEEKVIEAKILNSLNLDYPKDKLEIIIASDGSVDKTNLIVKKYEKYGVILNSITPRGGKARALNLTIPKAKHSIIVLSDANAMFKKDSIKQLVKYLYDKEVGAVTGDVRIVNNHKKFGMPEKRYYDYERTLQSLESKIWSVICVDGAMYALKKKLFTPLSNETILDDLVISMNIVCSGFRIVYNPDAIAYENATPTIRQEIQRRSRITAGGIMAFLKKEGLPKHNQYKLWFMYLSHKLLRWFTPIFLLILFVSNVFLLGSIFWDVIFALQCIFYIFAFFGFFLNKIQHIKILKLLRLPFYFCMVNFAALIGLVKGFLGRQEVTWKIAKREIVHIPNNNKK